MSEIKKVNYEQLCKLVDPEETCDKDGELKHSAIIEYMSKYPAYFVASVYNGSIGAIEYIPTDEDHPVLGLDKDRQYLEGYHDLQVNDHLLEFVQLFKDVAYHIHVEAELGSIFILSTDWA